MNTPIYDFVSEYISRRSSRLHMPGHKGHGPLLIEQRDITEIPGADVLSEAQGIIGESQRNAARLFDSGLTLYSTEGSSLSIRAMLFLALQRQALRGASCVSRSAERPLILAARNVHKSFLYACAMLDCEVAWIYPESLKDNDTAGPASICSCHPAPAQIADALRKLPRQPAAVYLTSPDYLGAVADIRGITDAVNAICGEDSIPVLVDNAHGAYLHFLDTPQHPLDLGAYMCCDSAHKTLPVLTGGAYLHLSRRAAEELGAGARQAMALFGSTSPSYLILQSLDLCNACLADHFKKRLAECVRRVNGLKSYLTMLGIPVLPSEPLKLVIATRPGNGPALAELFRQHRIEPEFADISCLVCMFTPENATLDYQRIAELFRSSTALWNAEHEAKEGNAVREADSVLLPQLLPLQQALSIREAVLAPQELIDVRHSSGRICAQPTVSCPPAIPIAVSGEVITDAQIPVFLSYGIEEIAVVRGAPRQ